MFHLTRRLLLITLAGTLLVSAAAPEKEAETAGLAWLVLLDQANYAESWEKAAGLFQSKLPKEKWGETLTKLRTPLGAVKSRKLMQAQHTTDLPGVPKGEYVILQFETRFEKHDKPVTETITPMLEGETWKVAGYFVR